MIRLLRGAVNKAGENEYVVFVGEYFRDPDTEKPIFGAGVGYLLLTSPSTAKELDKLDKLDTVGILTYTHVREDALQLFGFLTAEQLRKFQLALQISGVGPKIALTLSDMKKFTDKKEDYLKIKGVGDKLAEKLTKLKT